MPVIEKRDLYENGRTKRKYFVDENGIKQGRFVEYFKDGSLMHETNYKDGKENGAVVVYEKNEIIKFRGEHKNGKRDGVFYFGENIEFYMEGKKCNEEEYKTYLIKKRFQDNETKAE